MKGNTLSEFINDLLTFGGPEKEYEYRGKRYFMESQPYELDPTQVEFVIFECFGDENFIFKSYSYVYEFISYTGLYFQACFLV